MRPVKRKPLTDPPLQLSEEERAGIREFAQAELPESLWQDGRLRGHWIRCRNYYLEKGKQRRRWDLTFQNWLLVEVRIEKERYYSEHPQERGQRGQEPTPLLEILEGGKQ